MCTENLLALFSLLVILIVWLKYGYEVLLAFTKMEWLAVLLVVLGVGFLILSMVLVFLWAIH